VAEPVAAIRELLSRCAGEEVLCATLRHATSKPALVREDDAVSRNTLESPVPTLLSESPKPRIPVP